MSIVSSIWVLLFFPHVVKLHSFFVFFVVFFYLLCIDCACRLFLDSSGTSISFFWLLLHLSRLAIAFVARNSYRSFRFGAMIYQSIWSNDGVVLTSTYGRGIASSFPPLLSPSSSIVLSVCSSAVAKLSLSSSFFFFVRWRRGLRVWDFDLSLPYIRQYVQIIVKSP